MADLDVVEREAREAREEAARLRARVAALEAAAVSTEERGHPDDCWSQGIGERPCSCHIRAVEDALSGGTSALDAVVSAAVAEERARIRARVEALEAAARKAVEAFPKPKYAKPEDADQGGSSADLDVAYAVAEQFGWDATAALRDALRGGTSALDAVVSAAVAEERARIRAAIVPLYQPSVGDVLAIVGGAP